MDIGDYTYFFVGINHAFAVGSMFRGAENALQPNYRHLLVAYHGRASSVVVSKTPIRRPSGQILTHSDTGDKVPTFSPSRRLDIELELGAFICTASPIGQLAALGETSQYIFGYVLMNDWSACDIQVWEYVPLGPFNAKNFGNTISLWIILLDALETFSVSGILTRLSYCRISGRRQQRAKLTSTTSSSRLLLLHPMERNCHYTYKRQESHLVISTDVGSPHCVRLSHEARRPAGERHY